MAMTEKEAQDRMMALARRFSKERREAQWVRPERDEYPDEEAWEEALAGWRRRMQRAMGPTSKASPVPSGSKASGTSTSTDTE